MKNNLNSKIAVGTVQFGLDYGISNNQGKTSKNEVTKILLLAKDKGIETLDTAHAYGNSEKILGLNDLENFNVISKFLGVKEESVSNVLNESLDRLKQTEIYGYLAHNAQLLLENPKIWEEFEQLKQSKKIKKIGFSIYSPSELEKLLALGFIPDLIQVPYNFIDRRFENYFPNLANNGIEIHTRSAFLQGLLLMNHDKLSSFFNPLKFVIQDISKQYRSIPSRAGFLLRFCLKNPYISKVVIGVNNADQLEQNIHNINQKHLSIKKINVNSIPEIILNPSQWPK